jgi:hypothetical protein
VNDTSFAGALVISAWWHEGTLVARIRGYRRLDGPVEDLGVVVGDAEMAARVSEWLHNTGTGRPRGTE